MPFIAQELYSLARLIEARRTIHMSTIGIPAGHEQAEAFRTKAWSPHLMILVARWCQSYLQRSRSTPTFPDDAREQLQRDRLLAERRLARLSTTVRTPFW
jgi:hypothetical protein